jgi:23S rRNA (cytosine1962-C5)-methyltransferase
MESDQLLEFSKSLELSFKNALIEGECLRLFHGRGGTLDCLDYFNVDFYPPAVFVTIFDDRSFEKVKQAIQDVIGAETSLIIQKRYLVPIEREVYGKKLEGRTISKEGNLDFIIDLFNNQNPGLFLDMKNGKKWISENCAGKSLLNLFSYTCSVSVYALAAGATNVLNIDQKKSFLNIGRENHRLNKLDRNAEFRNWDIKKSINQISKKGPFDIVFCDPPSNQGKSFYYKTDYAKIIKKASKLLKNGGLFVACLNTPFETVDFIYNLFEEDEMSWQLEETLYSSSDYLEKNKENGLKICIFRLI